MTSLLHKRKRGFANSNTKISIASCKYGAEQTLNESEFVVRLVEERSKRQCSLTRVRSEGAAGASRRWADTSDTCRLYPPLLALIIRMCYSSVRLPTRRHPLKFVCTLYMRRHVDRSSLYCCHSSPRRSVNTTKS